MCVRHPSCSWRGPFAFRQAAVEPTERFRTCLAETAQLSAQAAAGELNRRGLKTGSGGQWHAMQVHRVRHRLGL